MNGIIPSLNTPFTESGELDLDSVRRLVDWTVQCGCAGMLFPAVAGEGTSLSNREFETLVDAVVQHNAGRLPTLVSATADSQAARIERARCAKRLGATGVCCQAPTGARGKELQAQLAAVAEAGPPLLMIQDLDWTGPGLPMEEILGLFGSIPAFRCIKVETRDPGPKYSALLAAFGGRLHVSGGWAVNQMMDALARGVHAFMPTEMERTYVALYNLHAAGRIGDAQRLFESLRPVIAFSNRHIDVSIRFFKQLRKARGLFATDRCRPPVADLTPEQQAEAGPLLKAALDL
jgi:4-hydroxy-tetrahydrodipicolinate synthase